MVGIYNTVNIIPNPNFVLLLQSVALKKKSMYCCIGRFDLSDYRQCMTKRNASNILEFLDVLRNDSVLNHEKLIDKPVSISLSKVRTYDYSILRSHGSWLVICSVNCSVFLGQVRFEEAALLLAYKAGADIVMRENDFDRRLS
uniref:Uncharacterized protein n=1 Tax=Tetranychus urticae TaxID=32264 RepID=T1L4P4_TETUR